jgi:hypothetical protein
VNHHDYLANTYLTYEKIRNRVIFGFPVTASSIPICSPCFVFPVQKTVLLLGPTGSPMRTREWKGVMESAGAQLPQRRFPPGTSNLGIEISSSCFDLGMHSGETSTRIGDFFANLIVLGSKPRQPLCVLARLVEHGLTTSSPTFPSDWGIFQMW